jgi:hypothetical protein
MTISIESTQDLEKLLNALSYEIVNSNHFYTLYLNIHDSIHEYSEEMNESSTFWFYTLRALSETAMFNLCRLYDTQKSSLSLLNLLKIIKKNLHYFSEEHFRERLKGNAFVENLSETARIPNLCEIELDINSVNEKNAAVQKLIIWRNNLYAHKGAKTTLNNSVLQDNPLNRDEILELINNAHRIYNKYLVLFKAESWSAMFIGGDDFKHLLNFARVGLKKYKDDLESEIA